MLCPIRALSGCPNKTINVRATLHFDVSQLHTFMGSTVQGKIQTKVPFLLNWDDYQYLKLLKFTDVKLKDAKVSQNLSFLKKLKQTKTFWSIENCWTHFPPPGQHAHMGIQCISFTLATSICSFFPPSSPPLSYLCLYFFPSLLLHSRPCPTLCFSVLSPVGCPTGGWEPPQSPDTQREGERGCEKRNGERERHGGK